jgi:hypothetical protein
MSVESWASFDTQLISVNLTMAYSALFSFYLACCQLQHTLGRLSTLFCRQVCRVTADNHWGQPSEDCRMTIREVYVACLETVAPTN